MIRARLKHFLNGHTRQTGKRAYTAAVFSLAVATAVRLMLHPFLGDRVPFATYLIAVLMVGWYGGLVPAIFCLAALAKIHLCKLPAASYNRSSAPSPNHE